MLGRKLEVMIDGPCEDSEYLLDGRHEGQAPEVDGKVILCDLEGDLQPGTFVTAKIIQAGPYDLVASLDLERELALDGDEFDPVGDTGEGSAADPLRPDRWQ